MSRRRSCPECGPDHPLTLIQLIDVFQGGGHPGLMFTHAGAKRSVWTGYLKKKQGFVHGFLCELCGRVLLYAMEEQEGEALQARQAALRSAGGGQLSVSEAAAGELAVAEVVEGGLSDAETSQDV